MDLKRRGRDGQRYGNQWAKSQHASIPPRVHGRKAISRREIGMAMDKPPLTIDPAINMRDAYRHRRERPCRRLPRRA